MNKIQLNHTSTLAEEILSFTRPADALLSHYFREHKKLGKQDRQEIAESIFALLRHLEKIQTFLKTPAKKQSRLAVLCALVIGRGVSITQLKPLLSEEEEKSLIAFKESKPAFQKELNTAAELPQWLIDIMQGFMSEDEIKTLGQALGRQAPMMVRVNTIKAKRDDVLKQLQAEGLRVTPTPYSPWGIVFQDYFSLNKHPLFLNGTLEVQDEGSQLIAQLTGAKRGDIVIDFCAGAGGKTLAMAAMMANAGRIYAFDISSKRLANLKPRLQRSGLFNIKPQLINNEHDGKLRRLQGKCDRVLVDAPCTGLGTLRRNPDLKYRQSAENVASLVEQQASILQEAAKLVKPKGRLVYATCSFLPQENEEQIETFLKNNPNFTCIHCEDLSNSITMPKSKDGMMRLLPIDGNTDGFFAAVLERNAV